jgi:hypothetical protein
MMVSSSAENINKEKNIIFDKMESVSEVSEKTLHIRRNSCFIKRNEF